MTYKEMKDALLLAFLAELAADVRGEISPSKAANKAKLNISAGQLLTLVERLVEEKYLDTSEITVVLDSRLRLTTPHKITWAGIQAAERLPNATATQQIPAADRYVAISDNQRVPIKDDLAELKAAIDASNSALDEDKKIGLSEIAIFETTICQPRIATDLIQRFVDTVLAWLRRTFSAATIQTVAQRLVEALLKLISPA